MLLCLMQNSYAILQEPNGPVGVGQEHIDFQERISLSTGTH